jgi:hypothetical protein
MKRILILLLLVFFSENCFATIPVISGHIHHTNLSAEISTVRWGGIKGFLSGYAEESVEPIGYVAITSPGEIIETTVYGLNFLDGKHYLAFIPANIIFNLTKLQNVTEDDLNENGIFNQTNFPIFHPEYSMKSDSPKNTFTKKANLIIGGEEFSGFATTLKENVTYYLLKYNVNNSLTLPIFFVPLSIYNCYDNTTCHFQAIVPLHNSSYYIYLLSKEPPIKLDVWIDGRETRIFSQTALVYNLTIRATNLYTGAPFLNTTVGAFEENGNLVFVPYFSGIVGRGASFKKVDDNGYAQFIIAPTEYPKTSSYKLYAAAITEDGYRILKKLDLEILNSDSVVRISKQLNLTNLTDHVKVVINSINPIINSLYKWANEIKKAWKYEIIFYSNGTFRIKNLTDNNYYPNATLKTGAPNLIKLYLKNPDGSRFEGYGLMEERDGYLLFNPTLTFDIFNSTRLSSLYEIYDGSNIIITPTSYADAFPTIRLYICNIYGSNVANITFNVDRDLNFVGGGYYEDDNLKTQINYMNVVGYNLYWSLNR